MKAVSIIFFLFIYTQSAGLYAQSADYTNEFGFKSDNDSYLAQGQDRYYTNGLFITFRHAANQSVLKPRINKKIWEFEAGQRIYNAQSGNIPDISYVDRPFAGYLYAGAGLHVLYNSENSLKLSLQAGTIGPAALGKEAQEFLHKVAGFYKIDGWQYQVNNAIGINSSIGYSHFLYRTSANKTDVSAVSYLNIGTTYSGAGLGILLRAGTLNQLFNSAINNSRVSNRSQSRLIAGREFFFFIKPMINFVAYDATVQGGLITDDKGPVTYDIKNSVISSELGAMYSVKRWTADFSVTFKSKEIKSTAKPHQFGSISVYYRFN